MTDRGIGIVGGGIGGLSLAIALRIRGLSQVTVFERSPGLSTRGGTIRLDPPTQQALADLGVLDAVEQTGIRNRYFETRSNGRFIHRMPYSRQHDNHLISISREALQKILAAQLGDGVVAFGETVTDIDADRQMLLFADGDEKKFSLIVGADGVFSRVADRILPGPEQPEFTGLVVFYCLAKGEVLPEAAHTEHYISRGRTGFRQVTVAGGATDGRWDSLQITTRGAACSSDWSAEGTVDEVRAYLDLAGDDCLPGAREIVDQADRVFKWGMYQSPERRTWVSGAGNIILIGDAAHAMAPFTGQGACTAIQDALRLAQLIAAGDTSRTTLLQFEAERKAPVEQTIRAAWVRGMHITAHGLTRWYIDRLLLLQVGLLRYRVPKLWHDAIRVTLQVGAQLTERIDAVIDELFRRGDA